MRKTHYLIVGILSLISISTHAIDSQKIAAKHPIIADKPVPGFFEGALIRKRCLGSSSNNPSPMPFVCTSVIITSGTYALPKTTKRR